MDIWFVDHLAPDISICIFPWWFAFCPCLFHFPNAFRLFLCLRWCLLDFSTLNHLWISFSSSFSLPKVVNKDMSERWGKGQLPHSPWRPPSPASPASWRLFTSTQNIFPSTWQDGQPRWSAFTHATSQDPLSTAKMQNSWMEHLFLSVFMLGLHTKERGLPSPQGPHGKLLSI